CGRAEFVELLAVQRIWLHGLDALPNAPELGLRCPCGPSLRSGNPLAAARAEALRSCGLGPSAPRHPADLATGLPDRGRGRGTVAPPANGPALGALQLAWTANCPSAGSPPRLHCPAWALGSRSGRL